MAPELKTEFCITGLNLSPEEVTGLLGILPTRTWHLGDSIQGTLLRRKHNGWCFSTPIEPNMDLAKSIKPLLDTLVPISTQIDSLCNKYESEAEISCTIYITDETPIINLDNQLINKLAELKVTIDIDIILVK